MHGYRAPPVALIAVANLALDQGSDMAHKLGQPIHCSVRTCRYRTPRIAWMAIAVLALDQGTDIAQQFGQPLKWIVRGNRHRVSRVAWIAIAVFGVFCQPLNCYVITLG